MRMRCLFLAGAASLLVLSCGKTPEKEKPEVKPEITVPSESQAVFSSGLSFEAGPQVQTSKVSFTTTASWSADVTDTKASAWLSVQPASGAAGTVNMTVSAQPNTGEDARRATVTIKCGTVTKAFTVTQAGEPPSDIPVTSVTLDKERIDMVVGGTVTLTAIVTPEDATDKTVTWSSSDSSVATVENGKVTAVKEGSAVITAKAGEKTATCSVKVVFFSLSPQQIELESEGGTFSIEVTSSIGYSISSMPEWIKENTSTRATTMKSHSFAASKNPVDDPRSGVIVFCNDMGACVSVLVSQKPRVIDIDWSAAFYHRSLIMLFTATWCPACPSLHAAVHRALDANPDKLVMVALHDNESDLAFHPINTLTSQYKVWGWPTSITDGRICIMNTDDSASLILAAARETEATYPVKTGIFVSSVLSDRSLSIELTVYAKTEGSYALTVFLLEDGIINQQQGSGGVFIHDSVARVAVTQARGDAFTIPRNNSFKDFNYSVTIPADCNLERMKILAFVSTEFGSYPVIRSENYGNFYVDNSISVPLGIPFGPQLIGSVSGEGNEGFTPGGDINL